jgi:hypothetical protein
MTREEREELRRRIGKRGALGAPVGFSGEEVAGLLAQIDALEKQATEALRFADCWAKAETKLNDMEIRKDAEIRALEKRLEKRPRMCENGTHEIAEDGECLNCALKVRLPTGAHRRRTQGGEAVSDKAITKERLQQIRDGSVFPSSMNPGFYVDATKELLADRDLLQRELDATKEALGYAQANYEAQVVTSRRLWERLQAARKEGRPDVR